MIKTLNNTIKQDRTAYKIPRSVQDVLPIQRIFADGIFQFGTKYSKTLRFSDINYAIASKEDKTAMFLGYSELLNALDSGSTTKLTICNKQVNRQAFEDTVLLPHRGDSLDGFVDEFNGMLEGKISGSSASVEQERFHHGFRSQKECGRSAHILLPRDGRGILQALAAQLVLQRVRCCRAAGCAARLFRPEEAALPFDLQSAMRRGHNLKDTICPDSLEFHRDYFKMGSQYGRVLFLKDYASYIKDSMILELSDLNRRMMLSIDMIPCRPTKRCARWRTSCSAWKRTSPTGSAGRTATRTSPLSCRTIWSSSARKPAKCWMISRPATSGCCSPWSRSCIWQTAKRNWTATPKRSSPSHASICVSLRKLSFQQQDGLITALPLGLRRIDALRTLTTEALAVLMPFKAQEIRHRHGIYYGQNAISKNLILADRKELLNGNGFILGVSGSGKSFAAKREITEIALSTNDDIIIIDPEAEVRHEVA